MGEWSTREEMEKEVAVAVGVVGSNGGEIEKIVRWEVEENGL